MYFVYLVQCSDRTLYCGITNDLERRVDDHNKGNGRGAKYTSGRRPVKLLYTEKYSTRSAALKREHEIKHMTRDKKMRLILSG